jgi:glycosyltransferase involved in cell wall biosynthesis
MPAYNSELTLRQTVAEVPMEVVDEVLLVDDASSDLTVAVAREMGLQTFRHRGNMGYGRNQKTCYREALRRGADIIVMVHPDYQYSPRLIVSLVAMIAYGEYDVVLGSRILGIGALEGGMPVYKYVANRVLTLIQNILLGFKLSEYHTGYRAYRRDVLTSLPLSNNSDDFVFDNEATMTARYRLFNER